MNAANRVADHRITFGIERDDGDRIPVASVPCPASWVSGSGMLVELMASLQDRVILAGMSLRRTDVADGAVAVIVVVPTDERPRPLAGMLEVCEALHRELGPVLRRAEQSLDEGVVVADARSGVGDPQPEPIHHRQDGGRVERRAVVPVQHRLVIERVQVLGGCSHAAGEIG